MTDHSRCRSAEDHGSERDWGFKAFSPDMRDFTTLLLKRKVRFALCGGFAVGVHGFIRATMDLDILIYPSEQNAVRIVGALAEFGFGHAGIPKSAFLSPGSVVTLGVQPNQIDILTSMSSEAAESVFADLEYVAVWGVRIPVVSRRALLRAKRESLRPKDRIDAEELERLCDNLALGVRASRNRTGD